MKIKIVLTVLFLISTDSVSRPLLEFEGSFAFNSFSNNVKISVIEKTSIVLKESIAFNLFGEQSYRNNSIVNNIFLGVEYRLLKNTLQVPIGVFGGINDIHIGQYTSILPAIGVNSGLILWLNHLASLRINYYSKLYFAEQMVVGNDVYIGFSIRLKMPK